MAFVSFIAEGRSSYGIVRPDGVFDLGRRFGAVLPDLKSFLMAQGLGILADQTHPHTTDYSHGQFAYMPVIPNPAKVLCVGLNYVEHRRETGRTPTVHPSIFTRFADTLTGHDSSVFMPPNSTALDWEGELAVVIGKPAYRVAEDAALDFVAGYSVFNDATVRDWQHHTHQFIPGKNFSDTGALGPAMLTPEEAGPLAHKAIETRVNGVTMQSARLGDMIFTVAQIISYISGFTRLAPGDVIATGTPGGVGFKRDPQVFLHVGDRVDVTVEGIGTLSNTVALEPAPPDHVRH
jgi:2-keto-4-pentenoate hydratase/2-oxohepta-3-ene-1,7-dioic acid hydratase in catechol pathway